MDKTERIAVVGGGITGLSCAFYLGKRLNSKNKRFRIDLIESTGRLGGVIETRRIEEDYLLEGGPDMFFTAKPHCQDLVEELGLKNSLIETEVRGRKSLLVSNGKLKALPDGFVMLAPSCLTSFMETEVLSFTGKLRVLMEPLIPARFQGEEESVSEFVKRRFGRELLDKVAQPMVGGIYVGDVEKLSAQSTVPQFVELEKTAGSIISGLVRKVDDSSGDSSGARYKLFLSFKKGMQELVDRIQSELVNTDVMLNKKLVSMNREYSKWNLTFEIGDTEAYDAVILTIPASKIVEIEGLDERLNQELAEIPAASSAVINFVFDRRKADFKGEGFGFVVPEIEGSRLIAASFSSQKFPGRCPEGKVIVRAFLGGAKDESVLDNDDGELCRIALVELGRFLSIKADPEFTWVSRWNRAMPQYLVGHKSRVSRINAIVEDIKGFELAGNSYNGVGIPDCIQSGKQKAYAICDYLNQLQNSASS